MQSPARAAQRIPVSGLLLALILGALLLGPAVARGDSTSRGAAPAQYRGPSSEVASRGLPILDGGSLGGGEASRSPEGWARWEFWFEYEKDSIFREVLRDRSGKVGNAAGDAVASVVLPSDADVRDKILPALRAALRDSDVAVRSAAAMALGNARDRRSALALADILARGSIGERRAAALALGFLRDGDSVAPLVRALDNDADADVRALAALALGVTGDPAAAFALRGQLARSLEPRARAGREIRVAVVDGLGLLGDREAVPLLQRILVSEDARDDRLRSHAAKTLGRIGDPAATPPLLRVLADDPDAGVRRAAALALGGFRDAAAAEALARAIDGDGDVLVRGLAAVALARSAGAAAGKTLVPLLDAKHDRSLRGFAAVALGLARDASAAPALRKALEGRSEDSLRSAAAVALGILGDRAALPRLWEIARDASAPPEVRGYAILGAAMTGDADVATLVKETLVSDAPREVLRSAALAAGILPFPGSAATLVRLSFEHRDPTVRGAALLADIAGGRGGALEQLSLSGGLPPVARIAAGLDWRESTSALDRATRVF